ncbi:MAG: hypothetical protein ACP5FK_03575 [bacterium]
MSDLKCLNCQGELEFAGGNIYARCKECQSLFMHNNNVLTPYPVDDANRPMIEQALGFTPSASVQVKAKPPTDCPICSSSLEVVEKENEIFTRCSSCGTLSKVQGPGGLIPIIVNPPGGGWNPEFQAIFEEKLGFTYKLRKKPIGILE